MPGGGCRPSPGRSTACWRRAPGAVAASPGRPRCGGSSRSPRSRLEGGVPDERSQARGIELVHPDEEQDLEVGRVGDRLQIGDASHLAQGDPAKIATRTQRGQRGDGAGRLEDEVPQRRDSAEGREFVHATQPPELHQLEAADLIEDGDVGDRAETTFEPAKPGERASHSRSTDPIPRRSSPTRRPSVSTSFHDPLTPSRRSRGRSPTARIERRFSVSPSASSSSALATWRRPSSEFSRSERAATLWSSGNQRSISRSAPASTLS